MPVFVGSVADIGLDYLAFAGKVSRNEALSFPDRVHAAASAGAARWITVFHRDADLSALDIDCMLQIKAQLKPRVAMRLAERPFRMIMVADGPDNDAVVARWREMTVPDPSYASKPEAVRSLQEACRRHGLTPDETQIAVSEIESDIRSVLLRSRADHDDQDL